MVTGNKHHQRAMICGLYVESTYCVPMSSSDQSHLDMWIPTPLNISNIMIQSSPVSWQIQVFFLHWFFPLHLSDPGTLLSNIQWLHISLRIKSKALTKVLCHLNNLCHPLPCLFCPSHIHSFIQQVFIELLLGTRNQMQGKCLLKHGVQILDSQN